MSTAAPKKDQAVNVRLTSEMREELLALARADGRDLAGYIRRVLELHIARERKAKG